VRITYKAIDAPPAPLVMFANQNQVDWRRFSSVQNGKIMTEADWQNEQVRRRYLTDAEREHD